MTLDKNVNYIVSGLERSGTSMLMQILKAGELPISFDDSRRPDENNPKGYYEFEPVKKTKEDPSWLQQAPGKVVKMVYRLLYDLPEEFEYRVLFMQRDLQEVLASQRKMLLRSGKDPDAVPEEQIKALFESELDRCREWLNRRPNFTVLYITYREMIADPMSESRRVNEFLGGRLDVSAMASSVDPSLYRNRSR